MGRAAPSQHHSVPTTVCAHVLDAPDDGRTGRVRTHWRNGWCSHHKTTYEVRDRRGSPASSTEMHRRERFNSPKGIRETDREKETSKP